MPHLKPCEKCGGKRYLDYDPDEGWYVQCRDCSFTVYLQRPKPEEKVGNQKGMKAHDTDIEGKPRTVNPRGYASNDSLVVGQERRYSTRLKNTNGRSVR